MLLPPINSECTQGGLGLCLDMVTKVWAIYVKSLWILGFIN